MRKALFLTKLRKHPTRLCCHPERSRRGIMLYLRLQQEKPAESKFCFLKLPIVFGYVVPFTAISKKQNRKGSPQSLIYPLKSKLTSFYILCDKTGSSCPPSTHKNAPPTRKKDKLARNALLTAKKVIIMVNAKGCRLLSRPFASKKRKK